MENEIKSRCLYIDGKLHKKLEELQNNGASIKAQNEMVRLIKRVQAIYYNVNKENYPEYDVELSNLEDEISEKYGKDLLAEEVKNNPETVYITEKKTGTGAIIAALAGGLALGGLGTYAYLNSGNNSKRYENEQATISEQNAVDSRELTEEELVNGSIDLVLGEYGTFFDAHDEEQVMARAQYLYDAYYSKFESEISDGRLSKMFGEHKDKISVEGIANVIRGLNGVPLVDNEGNYFVSANIGDTIMNDAAFYLFNVPSACYDENGVKIYHNVPVHLFVPDGSETSRFLKGYDEQYEMFCEAMNNNDGNKAYEAGYNIAEKMWYEWHMLGVFGDQNPYQLAPELKKIARMGSVDKWTNYIYEFEQDAQTAICVPVCVDYETKELSEQTGDEIQTAITFDLWDKPVAKSAGMEDEANYDMLDNVAFYQFLLNEINWQYENNYKGRNINDNGYTLSRK